jgi:hypothetical protein
MEPLRIFIGYDEEEKTSFHVLVHSILRNARYPISITPLIRKQLSQFHPRPRGPLESTDFSITRFLVPYLSSYYGYSIYMDCDMLCLRDITTIADEIIKQPDKDVLVCQHDYTPSTLLKMGGRMQTTYPRKNWSSFIVFNNDACRTLTFNYVNDAPALDLHRFVWANSIGSLSLNWNWLVGEYPSNPSANILHYTLGLRGDEREWNTEFQMLNEVKVMEV